MLTWKIVGVSKISVLYIYIDNFAINMKKVIYSFCKDTIYSPSPRCMGSWPNKPNTINL